jgi:hypothetical protein
VVVTCAKTAVSLGLALASVSPRDEEEFVYTFADAPGGWYAVAGLALVVLLIWTVIWLYRREGRMGSTMGRRTALAVIRSAVILALAIIWLEPVCVRYLHRWIDSYVLVLVDTSSSMDLTDTYREEEAAKHVKAALSLDVLEPIRRQDVAERLLTGDGNRLLNELAAHNRVKLYSFSDEPELVATIRRQSEHETQVESGDENPQRLVRASDATCRFVAKGSATNLERAVRRSVESLGHAPIAAVVVLSDGGINQGEDVEGIARYARDRNLPIHVVGIGDPSPPRNVRVAELLAPENALRQDPIALTVQLAAQGAGGEVIEVLLRERSEHGAGEGSVVERREVVLPAGGRNDSVTFTRTPGNIGRYTYVAQVPVQPWESVADDNARQATVNVIESRSRVLLIAGAPSWDYRFLSRLLERDDAFDVTCWLQSADLSAVRDGNTITDHLPTRAEELFEYDAVVLVNPYHEELDEAWCRLVARLVTEYGGGLLLAAGRSHTPVFMREPSTRPLVDLLPVARDSSADLVLNQIGHYQVAPWPVLIPEAAQKHPILRLADDIASSKLIWQRLGDVHWHYPVLRAKPVATVLMQHGNPRMQNSYGPHVLAAVQYVGAGRTAFVGFDATWRWRRHGQEIFDRFWIQMMRYLTEGKRLGGSQRGTLLTEGDRFSLGDAVTVTSRLFDARFQPLDREEVEAWYEIEGRQRQFPLSARSDQPGWFEGRFVPDRIGSYRIGATIPADGGEAPIEIRREIQVSRPNIEILRPQMDRSRLMTLAANSAGGRYFEVDEASTLPEIVPDVHEETTIKSRPTMLWDNGWILTLLVALLAGEWTLRKWSWML